MRRIASCTKFRLAHPLRFLKKLRVDELDRVIEFIRSSTTGDKRNLVSFDQIFIG
jgi:hypothetical protein